MAEWDASNTGNDETYLKIQHTLLEQAVAIPLMDTLSGWAIRDTVTGIKSIYSTYPALRDTVIQK